MKKTSNQKWVTISNYANPFQRNFIQIFFMVSIYEEFIRNQKYVHACTLIINTGKILATGSFYRSKGEVLITADCIITCFSCFCQEVISRKTVSVIRDPSQNLSSNGLGGRRDADVAKFHLLTRSWPAYLFERCYPNRQCDGSLLQGELCSFQLKDSLRIANHFPRAKRVGFPRIYVYGCRSVSFVILMDSCLLSKTDGLREIGINLPLDTPFLSEVQLRLWFPEKAFEMKLCG